MSLLVDLQLVPNRILEVVKARILANRAKLTSKQQMAALVKGATRPRPQRQKFNAKAIDYRRPEPAAVRAGGGVEVAGFTFKRNGGILTIGTKDGKAEKVITGASRGPIANKWIDDVLTRPTVYEYTSVGSEQVVAKTTIVKDCIYDVATWDTYSNAYGFPVDGSKCIVVLVDYFQSIRIQRYARLTEVTERQWAVDACGRAYASTVSMATAKEGGGLSVEEASDRKVYCFMVTSKTITEIAPPPGILDSLPDKLIEWEESPQSQVRWQEFRESSTEAVAINTCREYYVADSAFYPDVKLGDMKPGQEPWPNADWVCNFTRDITLIRPGDYFNGTLINPPIYEATVCQTFIQYNTTTNAGPSNWLPKIRFKFLRDPLTGSIPELNDWNPWGSRIPALAGLGGPGLLSNPGIFGPLNGVTAAPPKGATGTEIAEFYGLEAIAPKFSVFGVVVPGQPGTPPTQKRYDVYPGLLPVPSDPDPFSKLRKNPSGVMSDAAFAVWDWGRPGYCRQKLKEIGFFPDPPPAP